MADPVVFGDVVRTDPILRKWAPVGWQRPDNRNLYYILKQSSDNLTLLEQIREVGVGWGAETTVVSGGVSNRPVYDFAFNKLSDRMLAWRDTTGHVHTRFLGRAGEDVSTQHTSSGTTVAAKVSVCPVGPLDFIVAWAHDHDNDGTYDLFYRRWLGVTQTWDTAVNALRPNQPTSVAGVDGVKVMESQVNGQIHFVLTSRESYSGQLSTLNLYHMDLDHPTVFTRFGDADPGGTSPYSLLEWFDAGLSYRDEAVIFVVAADYQAGAPYKSNLRFYVRNDQSLWSESTIHLSATMGPHTPQLEVNTNDDVYVIWREYDTGTSHNALYFRRRLNSTGAFETPILVADSISNTTTSLVLEDPDAPGIIRSPIGEGILEFCVTWGDDSTVTFGDDTYVYVTCADIGPGGDEGFDFGDNDLARLDTVYVYDEPATHSGGAPWAKWQGTPANPLNVVRWLALDPTLDDAELLYGTADLLGAGPSTEAWVNQLLYGTDDNGSAIVMSWPTPILDMGDPGVVKEFLYVDIRISTMGGSAGLTFAWSVDDGRRTGTLTVLKVKGQHVLSLPQVVGRVLQITLSETGTTDPPVIQYMGVWWRAKGEKLAKRAEVAT